MTRLLLLGASGYALALLYIIALCKAAAAGDEVWQ